MTDERQFSIRDLMCGMLVVAFLVTIPLNVHRITVSHTVSGWIWLSYNAAVVTAIAFPIWRFAGRRMWVPALAILLFTLNFGPEIKTAIDYSVTGGNDTTGYWLAQRGLDYDPMFSLPCWCSTSIGG